MDANQLTAHFISELRQLEPRSEDASNKLRDDVFKATWDYTDSELFSTAEDR